MSEEKRTETNAEAESGLSLRDVFRIIGKKIWFVLGATVIVTLAAVLVFMFAINPAKQSRSMSFRIDYPMSDEGKYPDGSMFNYRDIVSREVIERAKNDPAYKDELAEIDVDKILKKEGITISATPTSDEPDAPYIYTVTLKSAYFGGVSAEDFISALSSAFASFVEGKAEALNYKLEEDIFNSSSYEDQLRLLTEQKAVIIQRYDELIKEYSAGHVVNGKSIGSYRMEVSTMLADTVKIPIENDLSMRGYEYFNKSVVVNGERDDIMVRVQQLQEEMKLDRSILEELRSYYTDVTTQPKEKVAAYAASDEGSSDNTGGNGSGIIIMPGDSDLSQKLAYYSERYSIIKQQLVYLTSNGKNDGSIDFENEDFSGKDFTAMRDEIVAFGDKLSTQFNILNERAETLKGVISNIYQKDTVLTFNSQRATREGGTNLVIVAVGVLVVSFVVFAVIAFFAGRKNLNKKRNATSKTEAEKTE